MRKAMISSREKGQRKSMSKIHVSSK